VPKLSSHPHRVVFFILSSMSGRFSGPEVLHCVIKYLSLIGSGSSDLVALARSGRRLEPEAIMSTHNNKTSPTDSFLEYPVRFQTVT